MAHNKKKYYVFTACRNCGGAYETRAKASPTAPNTCKNCDSTRTKKIRAREA